MRGCVKKFTHPLLFNLSTWKKQFYDTSRNNYYLCYEFK